MCSLYYNILYYMTNMQLPYTLYTLYTVDVVKWLVFDELEEYLPLPDNGVYKYIAYSLMGGLSAASAYIVKLTDKESMNENETLYKDVLEGVYVCIYMCTVCGVYSICLYIHAVYTHSICIHTCCQ